MTMASLVTTKLKSLTERLSPRQRREAGNAGGRQHRVLAREADQRRPDGSGPAGRSARPVGRHCRTEAGAVRERSVRAVAPEPRTAGIRSTHDAALRGAGEKADR